MKFRVFAVLICLSLSLFGSGCAGEEDLPIPEQKASVKKPIVRPLPAETPPAEPSPEQDNDNKPKEAMDAGAVTEKKTENIPEEKPEVKSVEKEEVKGVYVTRKGDTLSGIAGRKNVMDDPMKWTILYLLNLEQLKDMKTGLDLPDRPLPAGINLNLITEQEFKDNLKKMDQHLWVINILSSTKREKVIPVAIRLINEGYFVYITRATIKGKEWMRLRVGFFKSRNVTDIKGERIKGILRISDIWTTKTGNEEFQEFAGYYS